MAGIEEVTEVIVAGAESAVKGFLVLAGIALGAVVVRFGANVTIGIINSGVEVVKAIIA